MASEGSQRQLPQVKGLSDDQPKDLKHQNTSKQTQSQSHHLSSNHNHNYSSIQDLDPESRLSNPSQPEPHQSTLTSPADPSSFPSQTCHDYAPLSPSSSSFKGHKHQETSSSTIRMEKEGSLARDENEPSELPYAAATPPAFGPARDEQGDEKSQASEISGVLSRNASTEKEQGSGRLEAAGREDNSFWQQEQGQQQEHQSAASDPKHVVEKLDLPSPPSSTLQTLQIEARNPNHGAASPSIRSPSSALSSSLSSPSHHPHSMMRSSSTSSISSQMPSPTSKSTILPPPALSLSRREETSSNPAESNVGVSSSFSPSSSPTQPSPLLTFNILKSELNSSGLSNSSITPTTPSSKVGQFSPSPASPATSSTQAHAHSNYEQAAATSSSASPSQSVTASAHPTLTFTSASSNSTNSSRPALAQRSASSTSFPTSPASAGPLSPSPSTSSSGKEKERESNSLHSSSSSAGTPTSQSAGARSPSGGVFSSFRSNSPKVSSNNHDKIAKADETALEREADKRTRSSSTSSNNQDNNNFYFFNKSSRESTTNAASQVSTGPVPREKERDKEKAQEKERNRRSSSVFEHVGSWIGKKVHSRSESRGSDVSSNSQSGVTSRRTSMLNPGAGSNKDSDKSGGDKSGGGFGFWSSASSSSLALSGSALDLAEEGDETGFGSSVQPRSSSNGVNSARSTPTSTPTISHASAANAGSSSSLKPLQGHSSHRSMDEIEELSSPVEPRPNARRQFSGGGVGRREISQSRRISALERVLIQVTEDNERFAVVDVSGLSTAEAIKERMFSKLHLYDDVHSSCRLFRTEIGLSEVTSASVDDDELLALCMQIGDDKGNLKFLVQQSLTSPPTHGIQAMAPPPPLSVTASPSPRRRLKDLPSQGHGKSDSLSSSSSIGGALGFGARNAGDAESSDGHSRAASTLQRRTKAQRRPGTAGQSVAGSSPIESMQPFSEQPNSREGGESSPAQEILVSPAERTTPFIGSPPFKGSSATSPSAPTALASSVGLSSPSPNSRPFGRPATSHATSSSLRNNAGSQGWNEGSTSARPAVQQNLSQSFDEDRHEEASHDRIRSEEVGMLRNSNLSPQSRHGTSNGSQADRQSFSSSGSADSPSIHNARSLEDMRRLANGVESSWNARRPSTSSQNQEAFAVHPLDQKDGRYPPASVSRGSGSAGSSSYQTLPSSLVPGPNPSSGGVPAPHSLGSQILRQSSADSHLHRGMGPPSTLSPSIHDPRMVASPASLGGRSLQSPPMRYAHSPNPEMMYQGSQAGQAPSYGPRPDLGFNPHQTADPRFGPYSRPPPPPPAAVPVRPMLVQGGPSIYGHPPQPYLNDPHARPPPSRSPAPVHYTNEFGARINPNVAVRPNPTNGFGSPFPSRPHTYHDGPSSHQQINYRPQLQLQSHPHPQQHQHQHQQQVHYHPHQPQNQHQHQFQHQHQHQHQPQLQLPQQQYQQGGMQGGMVMRVQDREDPFTTAMFPASSSRQVSQFQRTGVASLSPGMTVQESLSVRQNAQPALSPGQSHHGAHPFGPRDPREQTRRPQSDYERYERTPLSGGRPEVNSKGQPSSQYHHHPHPASSPNPNVQNFDQKHQQRGSGSGSGQKNVQEAPVQGQAYASGRSSGSSFTSSSSHHRNYSNEDKSILSSTEESAGSAPTSARSSRSGPMSPDGTRRIEGKVSSASNHHQRSSTELASLQKQEDESREDLEDIDLLNIRPLPRPPQQGASPSTPRMDAADPQKSNEESSVNPHWGALFNALADDANARSAGGTFATTSSGGDTLRAAPRSDSKPHSEVLSSTNTASSRTEYDADEPNDGGTFASFQSFDDDDEETGTWAQPLQPDPSTLSPVKDKAEASSSERTVGPGDVISLRDPGVTVGPGSRNLAASPRRPELRLTIDTPNGSRSLSRASSPTPQATSSTSSRFAAPAPSPGINRRTSFARRESDWAFRPPPEQLYENLDDFFPKHDLDKPVLDATAALGSPLAGSPRLDESSPNHPNQPFSAGPGPFSSRTRHKKSIRIVAQDRKKFLERAEQAENRRAQGASQGGGGLARRRSTKLWGSKVLEMTPGQDQLTPSSSVNDSPSSDSGARPVFKWVKGDLIGKGTYGRVYIALNATTGEMIAVKQVELPRTAHDREDIRQKGVVAALKSEIETLKDLDHPHIVSYLGFEETPEFLSIFLEYVPGGSVGSCLRKHGKFEEPTIQSFLHQILEGLEYLHARGILHRDLKADNILVDFTGTCKISDFGTVRKSDDIYGNVENMSLQGSIFWMAPEVVSLSKKGYSAKVDIWSIGCVVLEMFAGRRPWSDDEAVQAMFKIGAERRAPPIPPDVHLTSLSAHFLKQCFAIEPSERPTAARLLEHRFPYPPPDWRFQSSSLYRAIRR